MGDALSELIHLDVRSQQYDRYIEQAAKEDTPSRQLMQRSGPGPTMASAIVAKSARICWAMLQRGEEFKLPAGARRHGMNT